MDLDIEKLRDKKILITGGTGFIGTHLFDTLKNYSDVKILSRKKNKNFITGDIRNLKEMCNLIKDSDALFHLAADVAKPKKEDLPKNNLETNTIGTLNVLEACRKNDVKKMIYSSTMSVFGNILKLPVNEDHPKNPINFYGVSKLAGEHYCIAYSKLYGLKTIILRYPAVYGLGQDPSWVIPIFIRNAMENKPITIFGSGKSSGDFVFVEDVVKANLLSLQNNTINMDAFNIGSGIETTIKDVAIQISRLFGNVEIKYTFRPNEKIRRFVFDISKAKRSLGYLPEYDLKTGLKKQIEFMKRGLK